MSDNLYSPPQSAVADLQRPEQESIARGVLVAIAIFMVLTLFIYLILLAGAIAVSTGGQFSWETAGPALETISENDWLEIVSVVIERLVLIYAVATGTRIAARNSYAVASIAGAVAAGLTILVSSDESLPLMALLVVTDIAAALLGAWLALRNARLRG